MKLQVIVIGGGLPAIRLLRLPGKAGLSVLLFEKQNLGGVCLNEGCIPTKRYSIRLKPMMVLNMRQNML